MTFIFICIVLTLHIFPSVFGDGIPLCQITSHLQSSPYELQEQDPGVRQTIEACGQILLTPSDTELTLISRLLCQEIQTVSQKQCNLNSSSLLQTQAIKNEKPCEEYQELLKTVDRNVFENVTDPKSTKNYPSVVLMLIRSPADRYNPLFQCSTLCSKDSNMSNACHLAVQLYLNQEDISKPGIMDTSVKEHPADSIETTQRTTKLDVSVSKIPNQMSVVSVNSSTTQSGVKLGDSSSANPKDGQLQKKSENGTPDSSKKNNINIKAGENNTVLSNQSGKNNTTVIPNLTPDNNKKVDLPAAGEITPKKSDRVSSSTISGMGKESNTATLIEQTNIKETVPKKEDVTATENSGNIVVTENVVGSVTLKSLLVPKEEHKTSQSDVLSKSHLDFESTGIPHKDKQVIPSQINENGGLYNNEITEATKDNKDPVPAENENYDNFGKLGDQGNISDGPEAGGDEPEAGDIEETLVQPKTVDSKVVSDKNEGQMAVFPEQEDSHFFAYFLTIVIVVVFGYLIVHNKQKILGLIVEGRGGHRRRSQSYRKLDPEAAKGSHIIY